MCRPREPLAQSAPPKWISNVLGLQRRRRGLGLKGQWRGAALWRRGRRVETADRPEETLSLQTVTAQRVPQHLNDAWAGGGGGLQINR